MDEYSLPLEIEKKQNVESYNPNANTELIYRWLDKIPFSKPPKTLARDFSDGVLMAELLKIYYPRLLEIYNCIPACNVNMKKDNWNTLNRKVFSKIDLKLNTNTISQIANSHHGTIEKLLLALHAKVTNEDVNYLQEPVQELDQDDISEMKIENIEELAEESPSTESAKPLEPTEPKGLSFLLKRTINSLRVIIISLMNAFCFWNLFGNKKPVKENSQKELVPVGITREAAYMIGQIHETTTRWAHEQLIHEKDDMINTLNHKIAYLEGTMRQKDFRIANLISQITNSPVDILPNSRQRIFSSGQIKLRPKSHNPLIMPNNYGS